MIRPIIVLCFGLLASGCDRENPSVPANLVAEAQAYIETENAANEPLEFAETWYLGGDPLFRTLCGEFEAPERLERERLRYFYEIDADYGQVEYHSLWLTHSSVTASILDANRAEFDGLWSENCEPHRPG